MSFNVMLYVYECTNHCFGHFNDLTDDRTTLYAHSFLGALFTDKTKSNHRVSVGRRSANNIQQGKAER